MGKLPLATTCMDLEGITLKNQSERDKYCVKSFICEIQMSQTYGKPLPGAERWGGGYRDVGLSIKTFSSKLNKFWASNVWDGDYS